VAHRTGVRRFCCTGVFLDSTTDFTVDAKSIEPKGDGLVRALITSPSGTLTEAIVKNQQNGLYQCLYTPLEQGMSTCCCVQTSFSQ